MRRTLAVFAWAWCAIATWACGSDPDVGGDEAATGPPPPSPPGVPAPDDAGSATPPSPPDRSDAATPTNPAWRLEDVAGGLNRPWSLDFAPDGRLLFTARDQGRIGVVDVASGAVTYLNGAVTVRAEGEAGMLGMALDPAFASNGHAYVCYSYSDAQAEKKNRVSRFTLASGSIEGEAVLVDAMPGGIYHNGCRVVVGPDELLYVSTGEANTRAHSQDLASLGGKILRVSRTGQIPVDNPFPGSAVYSLGHRNPQGLAFQPGTSVLWSTEHGDSIRDELNVIYAGKNYGWPACEGAESCAVPSYQPALREYDNDSTVAISDMAFYSGDAFPAWRGSLFFVTLKTGRLYRVTIGPSAAAPSVVSDEVLVDDELGRLRDVAVGPDGFIYVSTDSGNGSRIVRLRPTT